MSWLLKNAEDFLNKVDQSAADALQKDEDAKRAKRSYKAPERKTEPSIDKNVTSKPLVSYTKSDSQNSLPYSVSVPANLSKLNPGHSSGNAASVNKPRPSFSNPSNGSAIRKKDKDAELFEFLNSEEPVDNNAQKIERINPVFSHSRQSSTSSVVSNKSGKMMEVQGATSVAPSAADHGKTIAIPITDENDSGGSQPEVFDDTHSNGPSSHASGHQSRGDDDHLQQQQLSSLELENKLLRSEVASLNQEMASVIQRARDSQDELQKTKAKLVSYQQQMSASDQMSRELQSREADLTEALKAKDSQLGVLRVRFEETDKELQEKKTTIESLKSHNSRILQDHTQSTGVQSQAFDSMKEKLNEADMALQREKETYRKVQEESMQRQSQLEMEQKSLAEALTSAQRKLNEEKGRSGELTSQIKVLKSGNEAAKRELSDYKEKAARILQGKDKLIATLKDGANAAAVGASSGSEASSITATIELEEVRQEKEMYREELQQCRMNIENLRLEIQDLETQNQTDHDNAQDTIGSLEEQLTSEKRKKEDAEQEILKQKQELRYAHEELLKQKTNFSSRLQEKDVEIDKLRQQMQVKQNGSTSQAELENRLHALTESLIQKQTMLEALGTEKNSLGLQLERLERQYKDIQSSAMRASATHVHISEEDEGARQRLPVFMRESPIDTKVARGVKRAVNTLDRFGIKIGVFLKRYPFARIFVLLYMLVLHFWVTIVMMTYQPEIHGVDYVHPQAPNMQGLH
ncbi:golgin subfamily A member 5-like [Lineus longissimus]|uniref:golgin subfamily A member 5-like n=1 Tax=Lineus longissimus TaxID=88925 RepID=UPI002B4DDBE3